MEQCTADEYISGDNSIPVCAKYDDDTWENSFFTGIQRIINREERTLEMSPQPLRLHSFKEAIQALEDVQCLLGCVATRHALNLRMGTVWGRRGHRSLVGGLGSRQKSRLLCTDFCIATHIYTGRFSNFGCGEPDISAYL